MDDQKEDPKDKDEKGGQAAEEQWSGLTHDKSWTGTDAAVDNLDDADQDYVDEDTGDTYSPDDF